MSAVVHQGDTITLTVATVDALGAAADSADIHVTIRTEAGVDLAGFPLSAGIVHPGLGSYTYAWACPIGQGVATYQVVWFGNTDIAFATAEPLDVAAPPTAFLCTLADVRSLAHVDDPTNTADDAILSDMMEAATDLIHTITGRYFLPETAATYTFDGQWTNPRVLQIPRGIRTVTTLKVRPGGTGSALSSALGATEYVLRPGVQDRSPGEPATYIVLTDASSYTFALAGYDVIQVVGDFGYAAIPPTIERICRETVLRAFRRRASGMSESIGGDSATNFITWAMTYEDRKLLEDVYGWGPKVA
jgi:hypothetical protein